jgi:hypothetical protein
MVDDEDPSKKNPNFQSVAGMLAGDLLKKAVSLGAGAYVSAEDKVSKTLNTVQMPINLSKAMLKEIIDSFVETYSIEIKATVNFSPKAEVKSKEGTSKKKGDSEV